MPLRGPHTHLGVWDLRASQRHVTFIPLVHCSLFPLACLCLSLLIEELFHILSWSPVCGSAHTSKDAPSMGTSASVWKDVRAGMSMFVPVCVQTMSSAQYSMGRERRSSCCFLNSTCCGTCMLLWHPAASRHSHQCSTTILKNCFGFTVGDYWGEISHRPPRKKDSDHSPQKGFLLLSQLPCTLRVVFPAFWKLISFQWGAWGICSAAIHMELHLAVLTASEKLRAGSLLVSCTYYDKWRSGKLPEADTKVCKH